MKKYLFAVLLSGVCATTTLAQTEERDFIRTSIVAGIGANQIEGDVIKGYTKPGAILGAAARFSITDKLAFQPEVLYSQKGSRSTEEQFNAHGYIRWKLNYVEIPVLLTYEIFPKFTLLGGGTFGYLLGAKQDFSGVGYEDQTDLFNKTDLLWVAGLEYQIWDALSLDMRMSRSLVAVSKVPMPRYFYNNSIGLTLRYHLGQ